MSTIMSPYSLNKLIIPLTSGEGYNESSKLLPSILYLPLLTGGIYIVQLLDWYSASISVLLICIIEIIMVSWIYGVDNFIDDIYFMLGRKPGKIWRYCWKYITPIILIAIFITTIIFARPVRYNDQSYPKWSIVAGWCSCAISIICIPLFMLKKIVRSKGSLKENCLKSLQTKHWYPAQEEYRVAYYEFKNSQKIMKELNMNNIETLELLKKAKK